MAVSWLPRDHNTVSPYLIVRGAAEQIGFLAAAFDARELERHEKPGGGIMHAEVRVGDTVLMVADGNDDFPPRSAMLHVYVPDVDETYRRALAAGATCEREPSDQHYGDRSAGVKDRWGNVWWLATHQEDVSREEMARRAASAGK